MGLRRRLALLGSLLVVCSLPLLAESDGGDDSEGRDPEIPLMSFLVETGLTLEWNPLLQVGNLVGRLTEVTFQPGLAWVVVDRRRILEMPAIHRTEAVLMLPAATASQLRTLLVPPAPRQRVVAILIDPGHGGRDPGTNHVHTINDEALTVVEKEIVLQVGQELYRQLRRRYPDKDVVLTREDDTYVSLEQRVALANDHIPPEPDVTLFVSIHANASPFNADASGFEAWVLPSEYRREVLDLHSLPEPEREIHPILNLMLEEEITRESVVLAQRLLDGLETGLAGVARNRGIREESWYVVRNTRMPAALVELGFVTNQDEAERLTQADYLRRLAGALYSGVEAFVEWFEASTMPAEAEHAASQG